jgi:hypothetical protein
MKTLALDKAVGPDAEVITNEAGAHQSHVPFRFDLIPPGALFAVAEILSQGAEKYGAENWRGITDPAVHANHSLAHFYSWLCGDDSEGTPLEHLARAFCRAAFALEMEVLRLRAGGPQRIKQVYLSQDLTPGAHGEMIDVIERTKRALSAVDLSDVPIRMFAFNGNWMDPDKEEKSDVISETKRRKLVKAQWKGVNEKVGKMMADALFPELKKKRAAKKVVVAGKSARKAKLVNDLLKSRGKKVVAKKRAPRRK